MLLQARDHLKSQDHCDDLGRSRLDWPEPFILEVIQTAYGSVSESNETIDAARLHGRFLRALIDGETDRSAPLRLELIVCCAARHIAPEAIAAADHAVFQELNAIVQSRFRNSPRLRLHFVRRLHDALGRLTNRTEPRQSAVKPRRLAITYPSFQPRRAFALSG